MFPTLPNQHYQPQRKPNVAPTAEQKTSLTHFTVAHAENHYNKNQKIKQVRAFTSPTLVFHKNFISLSVHLLNSKL
jgi:ribosomal protein L7/L12